MEYEESTEIFEVEWIEKKCIDDNGISYYYIKWKDYPESENTWEPQNHMNCKKLMKDFERRCKLDPTLVTDLRTKKRREKDDDAARTTTNPTINPKSKQPLSTAKKPSVLDGQRTGFDEGLTAKRIIGATDSSGELMFLVEWKERKEASLINAQLATAKCPQLILEHILPWVTFLKSDSEN